jgi:uncharacterized glyoxalase superfamily protein PhnB
MTHTPSSPDAAFLGRALTASLTVADLARSTAWYCDVMGFAVQRRHERDGTVRAVSLSAGDVRILLTQDDGAKGPDRVKGQGISLQITTDQDIDQLAAGMRRRGGTLENDPDDAPWGIRMFRLRDPDGFRFTISAAEAGRKT